MKLFYWTGPITNFGDELNTILWPRLLPNFLDDDDREVFLGIGSILWDTLPKTTLKVVFGTGYGGYTPAPVVDDSWKIYCLRGRITASMIGSDPELGIGDPAMLLPKVYADVAPPISTGRPAFMPHWESAVDGAWEEVARRAGTDYVDPRWDVERVLAAIRGCSVLVTEAMHGAIVADAFRKPWVAFQPLPVHLLKWADWSATLGLTIDFAPSQPSTWLEAALRKNGSDAVLRRRLKHYGRPLRQLGSAIFRDRAVMAIREATTRAPSLSDDAIFERVTRALEERLKTMLRDYPRPSVEV